MSGKKISLLSTLILLSLGILPGRLLSSDTRRAERVTAFAPAAAILVPELDDSDRHAFAAPAVSVQAVSGATIRFKTQNGNRVGGVPAETRDLPHLVLHRNGELTEPAERTLIVEVVGIEVPASGATVTLSIETQHGDPDIAGDAPPGIPVWRESQRIANDTGITQTGVTMVFRHEFDDTILFGMERVATPTDYYRYDLLVTGAQHTVSKSHAFLLEDQWIVPLPEVREASPGAAPDELVVYFCDMVPFRKKDRESATRPAVVPRQRVPEYVRAELIPAMVEAFRIQTDEWEFPWYPEWTSYRSGDDAERLSVALSDGQTWFHGRAPGQGNAAISINVSRANVEYETLTDALMSTFHHELFHNHQRNIHQHSGSSGQVGGVDGAWDFFAEGMAVLASSVGQPGVQFGQTWGARAYLFNARGFIGREGISSGDLNKSYERMNGYHAAAYWRFLYEQCGGVTGSIEAPAAGMRVIRQVLLTLYSGEIVDLEMSKDLVGKLSTIMDKALESSTCPFKTHQQSLLTFARAIYALRVDGGRCMGPHASNGCGFYDPANLYHKPAVSTISYTGVETVYPVAEQFDPVGIPSSFGIDLIDIELDDAASGDSLTIEVVGASGGDAVFSVQLWMAVDQHLAAQQRTRERTESGMQSVYVIPEIDTTEYNSLGLIIIRLDAKEHTDPEGTYTIVLRPDA